MLLCRLGRVCGNGYCRALNKGLGFANLLAVAEEADSVVLEVILVNLAVIVLVKAVKVIVESLCCIVNCLLIGDAVIGAVLLIAVGNEVINLVNDFLSQVVVFDDIACFCFSLIKLSVVSRNKGSLVILSGIGRVADIKVKRLIPTGELELIIAVHVSGRSTD